MQSKLSRRAALFSATCASAILASAGAFAQQAATEQTTSQTAANEYTSEEIVVTAQKREEVLKDIPQSVTVVTEKSLERQQATSYEDFVKLIPGLSLQTATAGVNTLTLRGVNTNGGGATVGVYVDEVPFGSSTGLANGSILAADFDTFDVARLEVLRGPQGTLYGASSLSGLVKYVTNPPSTDKLEVKAKGSVETVKGGDLGYSGEGLVNVPLGDRLAIRASGFYRFDDGFVDSIGNNPITSDYLDPSVVLIPHSRIAKNINDRETYGGRISALFNASDTLSLRLTAFLQNLKSGAGNYYEGNPQTLKPLYGDLTQSSYHKETTDIKYRVYSGTLNWDFGFANLVSATSYATIKEELVTDGDFQLAPITALFDALGLIDPPLGRPVGVILHQITGTDKFTQEVRLASPDNDTFEWLVGGYYTHEKSGIDPQEYLATEPLSDTPIAGASKLADVFLRSKYDEYAGFANATLHITPRFDISAGGRVAHNKQVASESLSGPLAGGTANFRDSHSSETVFTYSVAPRFELSDNTSVYARVASGFRPGGPNAEPPGFVGVFPLTYGSDRLTSYEVGLKGDWLDRALSLDIAAYYLDWKNIQLFAIVSDTGVNANGGGAISRGLEFTATARPTRGLTFSLNGSYINSKLTDDTPDIVGGFDGDPLPYVPRWSGTFDGTYEWTVMNDATAYVGGTIAFVGDRTADFSVRDDRGHIRKVPSYTTVDLRAGLDVGHWSVQAYVQNLADTRGVNSFVALSPGVFPHDAGGIAIVRPRTVGVSVGVQF